MLAANVILRPFGSAIVLGAGIEIYGWIVMFEVPAGF